MAMYVYVYDTCMSIVYDLYDACMSMVMNVYNTCMSMIDILNFYNTKH